MTPFFVFDCGTMFVRVGKTSVKKKKPVFENKSWEQEHRCEFTPVCR